MFESLRENWWIYWGLVASAGFIWFRFSKTDDTQTSVKRIRSLIRGNQYDDPASKSYDPGLFGRQIWLLLIGLPLIGLTVFIVWLARG